MRRKQMNRSSSKRIYKKNTGIHAYNNINPRTFRGGIRL